MRVTSNGRRFVIWTGSLQIKNNMYYAVLNFKDGDGKRKQKWISTGLEVKNNKRKAKVELNKIIAKYEETKIIVCNRQKFVDFMESWLETIKLTVKSTTYDGYCINFNKHIKPYFKKLNVTLDGLTPLHIQSYYNDMLNEGLSAATINKHHANIHKALDYALKMNIIPYNPADRVYMPKIESCVLLTVNYGFRRSEVLWLRWESVDFNNNTISVCHTALAKKGGTLYDDTTKNQSSMRTLPLTDTVKKYLLALREHHGDMKRLFGDCYSDNDYICKFDDGHLFRPDYVSHKFKAILEKSSLPIIRFHDLRHSAASFLINAGFNLKEIQEWLGHSDIATTGNIMVVFLKNMTIRYWQNALLVIILLSYGD